MIKTHSHSDQLAQHQIHLLEVLLKSKSFQNLGEITIIGIIPHSSHLMQAINEVQTPLLSALESIQVGIYGRSKKPLLR